MRNACAMQKSAQGLEKKIKDQQNETFEKAEKLYQKTKKTLVAENAKMVERSRAKHRQILEKAYKPDCPGSRNPEETKLH